MSGHDTAAIQHHLRGMAASRRPIVFVIDADDIMAMREAGHSDAEIRAAIALLAPQIERIPGLLPGALIQRADEIEGAGR